MSCNEDLSSWHCLVCWQGVCKMWHSISCNLAVYIFKLPFRRGWEHAEMPGARAQWMQWHWRGCMKLKRPGNWSSQRAQRLFQLFSVCTPSPTLSLLCTLLISRKLSILHSEIKKSAKAYQIATLPNAPATLSSSWHIGDVLEGSMSICTLCEMHLMNCNRF